MLENPIYKESWEQLEQMLVRRISQQGTKAAEAEELRQVLIGMNKARGYLEQVVATGTMAALEKRRNLLFRR